MAGIRCGASGIFDTESDIEDQAANYREWARYLRRMVETAPARPDRDWLEALAKQYEQLAERAEPRRC